MSTDIPVLTFELPCDANEPSINSKDTNEINKNLRIDVDLMLFVRFDLVVMKCEMCVTITQLIFTRIKTELHVIQMVRN